MDLPAGAPRLSSVVLQGGGRVHSWGVGDKRAAQQGEIIYAGGATGVGGIRFLPPGVCRGAQSYPRTALFIRCGGGGMDRVAGGEPPTPRCEEGGANLSTRGGEANLLHSGGGVGASPGAVGK